MKKNQVEEMLTDKELCEVLGVHPATMRRLLKSGASTGIRSIRRVMVGNRRRWSRASLDQFLHGKRQGKL